MAFGKRGHHQPVHASGDVGLAQVEFHVAGL
jgi:hypothetical protein